MEEIQQAQEQFALAMTQYAEQLKSHTSAIEGLSKASRELTDSAAEQNKVFSRLVKLLERVPAGAELIASEPEENKAENTTFPSGCYRRRLIQNKDEQVLTLK
jgi:septation ring formation regulator EzrA